MKIGFKILAIGLLSVASVSGYTQPFGPGPQGHGASVEEQAKEMADAMQREVDLDAKQYKSVYRLFLKDFKFIRKVRSQFSQGQMSPMGGGSGLSMGGDDGQMGVNVDSRSVGLNGNVNLGQGVSLNGNVGAGMGGVGVRGGITIGGNGGHGGQTGGGHAGGGMPSMGGAGGNQVPIPDKYLEKEDVKLRKILSSEQFDKWFEKHPSDYLTYFWKSSRHGHKER